MPPKLQIVSKAGKSLPALSDTQRRLNAMRLEMARIDEEQAVLDMEEQLLKKRAKLAESRRRLARERLPEPREEKQREEKQEVEERAVRPAQLILTDTNQVQKMKSIRRLHYKVNNYPLSRDTVVQLAQRVMSVATANKNLRERQIQLGFQSAGGIAQANTDIVVMDARNNLTLGAVMTLLTELLENKIASTSGGEWVATDLQLLGKI